MEAAERPHLLESSKRTQSKQPSHLRKTSEMPHNAWASMAEQEAGDSCPARGTTDCIQVSTREIQLNRSPEEGGAGAHLWGKGPEGPGAMQVFPKKCLEEEGRKVNALLYWLEEAELCIVTTQGGFHPSDSPASERKREMTDCSWPLVHIYNFGRQQSWEREVTGGSREMTDAPQGVLQRQISRSDSEGSGTENRQVNRLMLNSPGEENKAGILSWLDFSAGKENGERENSPVRRNQEPEEETPRSPGVVIEETAGGLPWPPNSCHVGEEKPGEFQSVTEDKSLEIKRSTLLSLDLVSAQTRKPFKQACKPSLKVKEDEGLCGQLGFDSCSPVESLQNPETKGRPMETSKSSPSMLEMLLCPSQASGESCQASGEAAWGDEPVVPLQQRKGTKQQEEEKSLKVADVKKTFEKRKPAAEKAASPARKGEIRA
ncbi:hypothetical protein Chor_012862 [Crotalus horridus]